MWPRSLQCFLFLIFSLYSSNSYGVSEEFLRIISNTTLEQEQTYEAEKKIIEAIQDRKVDESDYKPIVEGEFSGSLLLYDNFRKDRGLSDKDKHDFSLTSISSKRILLSAKGTLSIAPGASNFLWIDLAISTSGEIITSIGRFSLL